MIHRLDVAVGSEGGTAPRQIIWAGLSMVVAALVLVVLRDHRILRRYTYTAMLLGLVAVLLPLLPILGSERGGARIWIELGPLSFQPGEIAKILLTVFFAGYLIQALSLIHI